MSENIKNLIIFMVSRYLFNHKNFQVGSGSGQVCNKWPPRHGSIIQDYGSTDPDPQEIFTDPQNWKIGNICKKCFLGCDKNLSY
jgi:hypothetical protein